MGRIHKRGVDFEETKTYWRFYMMILRLQSAMCSTDNALIKVVLIKVDNMYPERALVFPLLGHQSQK